MVSLKHLSFFLIVLYLISAASAERYRIVNEDTSRILMAKSSQDPILAVPFTDKFEDSMVFEVDESAGISYTIKPSNLGGLFVNCPTQSVPCLVGYRHTPFRLTKVDENTIYINIKSGLKLTVGKIKEDSVTLEQSDASLNQLFKLIPVLD